MHLLPPGSCFAGRFIVAETLGVGAAGAVLMAHDTRPESADRTDVALKILRPELAADEGLRARFRREASVLQGLLDPAIVRVWTHGAASLAPGGPTLPYLVMERLAGGTLRTALTNGPQSLTDVLTWLAPVAGALDRVHAEGVLHGDVKPDNVFLSPAGPRLVDFGSAKVHGFPRLTATGELAGTPLYMAPEVIAGDRGLDQRSDVYALAVTAYESLEGHPPFRARHPGRLLTEIMSGDEPRLQRWDALSPVFARAMHRAPAQRFDTAGRFAEALADVLARGPQPSPWS